MTEQLLLFANKSDAMQKRFHVFESIFWNTCFRRGDDDPITGAYSKLLKLEDGRVDYTAEMLNFAQLVIEGTVLDEMAMRVLFGSRIQKNDKNEPIDVLLAEKSLEFFDSLECYNKAQSEMMDWLSKLFPGKMPALCCVKASVASPSARYRFEQN